MILNEEILELARKHLDEFPDDFTATKEQLIAFAQKIYQMGYNEGCYETSYSTGYTGLVGDPQ
jgi:hypothetical protein